MGLLNAGVEIYNREDAPTRICEVCGVVARVVDGSRLGLIELLVFYFLELNHCGGLLGLQGGVEGGARVYCGGKAWCGMFQ